MGLELLGMGIANNGAKKASQAAIAGNNPGIGAI